MRKQKTGLQKDVGAIFKDAVMSQDVKPEKPLEDVETVESTETESCSAPSEPIGVEENWPIEELLEDPVTEEPRLEDDKPLTETSADEENLAGENQTEVSGFRRFLRLFTE